VEEEALQPHFAWLLDPSLWSLCILALLVQVQLANIEDSTTIMEELPSSMDQLRKFKVAINIEGSHAAS
jgi:hypothetical protein